MDTTQGKWWSSSQDPNELALTIKGLLMMYVPALLVIGQFFFPALDQSTLVNYVGVASTAIAIVVTVYGFARKVVAWTKGKVI